MIAEGDPCEWGLVKTAVASRLVAAPTAWRSRRPGSEQLVNGAARRLRPLAGRGAAAEGGPPRAVAARHLLLPALFSARYSRRSIEAAYYPMDSERLFSISDAQVRARIYELEADCTALTLYSKSAPVATSDEIQSRIAGQPRAT